MCGSLWLRVLLAPETRPRSTPLPVYYDHCLFLVALGHVALDFITELPPSNGFTVILVVVDQFSKAAHFIPLPKLSSAPETAQLVAQHVFCHHGLPQDVASDRGPQFASRFWRAFCSFVGASASLSSGFHPETNRQTERTNQTLERTLCCLASSNSATWSDCLPWAEYAHNTLQNASTGEGGGSAFGCPVCSALQGYLEESPALLQRAAAH